MFGTRPNGQPRLTGYADPTQLHNTQVQAVLAAITPPASTANAASDDKVAADAAIHPLATTVRTQLTPPQIEALIQKAAPQPHRLSRTDWSEGNWRLTGVGKLCKVGRHA